MADFAATIQRLYRWRPSKVRQRQFLVVASVGFVVGAWLSFRSLGLGLDSVRWWLLVVAGVLGVPLTVLANTGEYLVTVRMVGSRTSLVSAVRLTVVATAANLLPVPGALLVRTQGLRNLGTRTRHAVSATAVIGLAWIGVSAVLAGLVLLLVSENPLAGAAGLAGGVVLLATSILLLRRFTTSTGQHVRLSLAMAGVELFGVAGNAVRLVLVLYGIGVEATVLQTFVLAVSSSLSSVTGILPGGFGLREAIAAGLAPLVGLPASAGFAATAANRVLGMVAMAPLAAILAVRQRSEDQPQASASATKEESRP